METSVERMTSERFLIEQAARQKKPPKYRNTPTMVDGIRFDSKKEADRWGELWYLEKARKIAGLSRQKKFPLHAVNAATGVKVVVGHYVADFVYRDLDRSADVVEDVKSEATRKNSLYVWKKKHLEAQEGIVIREI